MKTQDNVYRVVHRVLHGGMIASTVLFVIGIGAALRRRQHVPLDAAWIRGHYRLSSIGHGIVTMDATTIMMIATALMILTPAARVLVSIWAFWVDRDRKFVVVTSIVALIMMATLVLAGAGLT
ncbi:MAG TPA: DUF1634 domain-containing protein [Polyangiaceae bacterium]|jgi:uncharacterized membrane protein